MPIKLADLVVKLGADSAQLQTEFAKSKKSAKTWKKDMDKVGKAASTSLRNVSIAAGVATTGLTALYAINAKSLDALGKSAAKLGETATGMNTIGLAANYGGVEIGTMTSALGKMTDIVSNAANGLGTAGASIRELGLDVDELNKLRPSEQFEAISRALEKIPSQNDRIRLSMDFYGKSGADLLNVTTTAIERAVDRTEALDRAFGGIDTTAVEAANDSLTDVSKIAERAGQAFTIRMAPAVKIFSDQLFESITNVEDMDKKIDGLAKTGLRTFQVMANKSADVLDFVNGNPDLVKGGILGYMLGGKGFGLIAATTGAAIGGAFDLITSKYRVAKGYLDETVSEADFEKLKFDAIKAEIAALESPLSGLRVGDSQKRIDELQGQLKDVEFNLVDLGEYEFLNTQNLEKGNGLLGDTANGLREIGSALGVAANAVGTISDATGLPNNVGADGEGSGSLSAADEGFLTSEQIRFTAIESAQANHFANLKAANEAAKSDELFFQMQHGQQIDAILNGSSAGKLKGVQSYFGAELGAFAQHSRKLFKVNKALQIGNVISNTAAGITKAFSLGFPKGLLYGAKVAAAGALQLKKISDNKFGGGAVAPNASASGGLSETSSNAPSAQIDEDATKQATQSSTVYVLNGMFAKSDTVEVVGDAFKSLNDNGLVNITDGELDTRNIIEVAV